MRVPAFLAEQQVEFETIYHPPAFTAQKRAKYLRVPGKQLVKSVLLRGQVAHFLAVLPATAQVDLLRLGRVMEGEVRVAEEDEVTAFFPDCEWGALSPFGSLYGLATLLEDGLDPEAMIVFEAHTHGEVIRMRCCDFEALEGPRRLPFAI